MSPETVKVTDQPCLPCWLVATPDWTFAPSARGMLDGKPLGRLEAMAEVH
ncbi:MAG: hypothetical protein ACYCS7_07980 [Acidimicrobiales bacterium]